MFILINESCSIFLKVYIFVIYTHKNNHVPFSYIITEELNFFVLIKLQVRKIVLVQACVRRWLARVRYQKERWQLAVSVVTLQRFVRGWLARRRLLEEQRLEEQKRIEEAKARKGIGFLEFKVYNSYLN